MNMLLIAEIDDKHKQKILDNYTEDTFAIADKKTITQSMIDEADVIIGNPSLKWNFNQPHLKALLLNSAGNDLFIKEGILNEKTRLTNASGSYGHAISEHILGMLIALNKNFRLYDHQQDQHVWMPDFGGKELYHSTVMIVGLGNIGYELAKRLKGFDCHVIGIKKHQSVKIAYVDVVDTIDHMKEYLPESDYVILCLPETKETIHLFNDDMFALMKQGSVICNVGRGTAIENSALLRALHQGKLYGAALDVVEGEPLSKDSPLWSEPGLMITPHCSGGYHWDSVQDYYTDLVIRNIAHLKKNESLENEVDFSLGYRKNVVL